MDEGAAITSRPGAALTAQAASGTSHKLRKRSWGAVFLAPLALVLAPSASAWVVDQQSIINFDGSKNYASAFEIIDLPILDIAPSISFNAGLVSGGASGHANVDARFAISSSNSEFDLASKANARTFMFTATPEPTVGESFYLINQIDSLGIQKLNIQSNGFSAFAGLFADLGGSAWGQACAGFCVNASLKLKVSGPLPLADVDAGGFSLFGSLVDSSLPYAYSGLGGLASGSASIPTFSKTFTNLQPGQSAVMAPKQESVLTAKLDVAGLVAKAAGFPIPLKGDLLGFGYELLSLDAFAGLNLEHAFNFNPFDLKTIYQFSSPVEFFDTTANAWSNPLSTLTMRDNESIQLRSSAATSIGISRLYELDYKLDYDFNLLLNAGVDLSALELHGLGLSLGPLIDPDRWKISLGKFDIDSGSSTGYFLSNGGASTISFKPQTISNPGVGYVTETTPVSNAVQQKTTYRVLNFGSDVCNGIYNIGCIVDPEFVPLITQARNGPDGPPSRTDELLALLNELGFRSGVYVELPGSALEYAMDFEQLGRFLAAAPLIEGAASSPEMMLAALRELGIDPDDPFPPRQPLTGAPPLKEGDLSEDRFASLELISVPEPSALALLVIAGLALAGTRRRRLTV